MAAEDYFVDTVNLAEAHLDKFMTCGGQVLANVIGADGKFTMATVDDYGQLDLAGTSEGQERIHRRADGPAGVEDVIDKDDGGSGEVPGNDRGLDCRTGYAQLEVISKHRDVEFADWQRGTLELADQ